jgi:hypothetical protein
MAMLNQIIAVEKGVKSEAHSRLTALWKGLQKGELFNGFQKNYRKSNADDADLPSEGKKIQLYTTEILTESEKILSNLFNLTARKDWTNCVAKGTVRIGDQVIVADAPVSFLLFLEKQLTDLRADYSNLPVQDSTEDWTYDSDAGFYKSAVVSTHRTKKVTKPIVLYPHSEHHPAQTQLIAEDIIAGYWDQTKFTAAIPATRKAELLEKVNTLLNAVKTAREEANVTEEVKTADIGKSVFNYLFS